jgi:L-alanine-DL-glutamate epimerase-like enolase superfamily enzyme
VVKADCAIVMAHTDEGITGIGEACAYGGPELIRDWVTFYKEPPMIREGVLHFSDKPGLGVKLADELEQRFPYFTGAWGLQIQRDDIKVAAQ